MRRQPSGSAGVKRTTIQTLLDPSQHLGPGVKPPPTLETDPSSDPEENGCLFYLMSEKVPDRFLIPEEVLIGSGLSSSLEGDQV